MSVVRSRHARPGHLPQTWGMRPSGNPLSPQFMPRPAAEKLAKTRRGGSGPRLAHDHGMKINLKLNKQRKIALGVLAAAAALAFWPDQDPLAAAPKAPPSTAAAAEVREPVAAIEMPARGAMPRLERDPFSAPTPTPTLGRPTAVAAAPVPAIPANPYRFAGALRVGGATQRFLARGNDTFE